MDAKLKTKLLTYALIFLLVLNLATITTIVVHIRNEQKSALPTQSFQFNADTTNASVSQGNTTIAFRRGRALPFRRIVRELNLTSEQYQAFVDAHSQYIAQIRPLLTELHKYRESIDQELAKDKPNMRAIKRYSRKIGRIHKQLSIVQSEYYVSLAKVCTPEQRQKLYDIYRRTQVPVGWRNRRTQPTN